jgi:hypothetical protein
MSIVDEVAARIRVWLGREQQMPAGADLAGEEWQEMPRLLPGAAIHLAPPPHLAPVRPTEEQEWAARLALAKCDGDPRTNRPTALDDEWAAAVLQAQQRHTAEFARKTDRAARKGPPPVPRPTIGR